MTHPAAIRGTNIHNSIEDFMNRKTEMLHPDIHEHYGQFFFGLRENYRCEPEAKWAFDWEWRACDYDAPDCMIRGFMDLKLVPEDDNIQVYELKTGKIYPDHDYQKLLYGTAALIQHPDKSGVDVTGLYLDLKQNRKIHYSAEMLAEYKGTFNRDIKQIEECEDFIPKPEFICRWCPFRKDNGGPCQF